MRCIEIELLFIISVFVEGLGVLNLYKCEKSSPLRGT